jgi:hypothetical protein
MQPSFIAEDNSNINPSYFEFELISGRFGDIYSRASPYHPLASLTLGEIVPFAAPTAQSPLLNHVSAFVPFGQNRGRVTPNCAIFNAL